jgi:hypothetical protein
MARQLRVQYPGAVYHVMNRGDHLEVIFRDGEDPRLFLRTLDEGCARADWQVHLRLPDVQPFSPGNRDTSGQLMDTDAGRQQFAIHMEADARPNRPAI